MRTDIFPQLGQAIRAERQRRGLSQIDLAARVGRDAARISNLERDLRTPRLGKDRLTLLVEICDALDLALIAIPRSQASQGVVQVAGSVTGSGATPPSMFDELFVDLGDEGAEDGRG